MRFHRLVLPPALLASLFLLSGCQSVSQSGFADTAPASKAEAFTHPQSGIIFPKSVADLERVSVTADDPVKAAVTVFYTATDKIHLERGRLSFFLNVYVAVIPATAITPERLLEQDMRACESKPNFVRDEYQAPKIFGAGLVLCASCTFDRPIWNDRASYKVVICRHGSYLVRFTFVHDALGGKDWQSDINDLAKVILSQSARSEPKPARTSDETSQVETPSMALTQTWEHGCAFPICSASYDIRQKV